MQDTIEGAGGGFFFILVVAGTITVAFIALALLPILAPLAILIFGPFRDNLRWPKATRKMAILSFLCMIPWNINPSWYQLQKSIGPFLSNTLRGTGVVFMIASLVVIPATILMCLVPGPRKHS